MFTVDCVTSKIATALAGMQDALTGQALLESVQDAFAVKNVPKNTHKTMEGQRKVGGRTLTAQTPHWIV